MPALSAGIGTQREPKREPTAEECYGVLKLIEADCSQEHPGFRTKENPMNLGFSEVASPKKANKPTVAGHKSLTESGNSLKEWRAL
jgi:hypothetical protein